MNLLEHTGLCGSVFSLLSQELYIEHCNSIIVFLKIPPHFTFPSMLQYDTL
jgi:hypothetical protein